MKLLPIPRASFFACSNLQVPGGVERLAYDVRQMSPDLVLLRQHQRVQDRFSSPRLLGFPRTKLGVEIVRFDLVPKGDAFSQIAQHDLLGGRGFAPTRRAAQGVTGK